MMNTEANAEVRKLQMANTALLECLVQQVREAGLATGPADTPEQLMDEVLEQVKMIRKNLRSVRARLAEYEPDITGYEYE